MLTVSRIRGLADHVMDQAISVMCQLHVNCHTSGVLALASSHGMRDTAPLRELSGEVCVT